MGILNKLFGSKAAKPGSDPAQSAQFDREWFAALNRFQRVAGIKEMRFDITHPRTGAIMPPHEGLGATFADWRKVDSLWDRRRVFFQFLLKTMSKSLTPWQIANVMVASRAPNLALELLQKTEVPEANEATFAELANFYETYARTLQYLQRPAEALDWLDKAQPPYHEQRSIRLRRADLLYMTGACDEADQIYAELTPTAASEKAADANVDTLFADLFSVETGAVPSPVLAIEVGERLTDPQQVDAFWQLGEAEFYDSAYFRMHHAYYLVKQGKLPHALAKLVALVQEMPWLREASINLDTLFQTLDPSSEKIMPEFQQQLRARIAENGWTTEGMWQIKIDTQLQF